MDVIVNSAVELYEGYLWTLTFSDPRVKNWPLMSSPLYTVCWTLLYFLIVWSGPIVLQNVKPLQLRPLLILYNFAMVALNLYIFVELLIGSWRANYNLTCQPVVYSNDPNELRIANALWWFYISKLFEFCDTFFFILRKKFTQITFLHVYHHSTMFMFWWIGVKWVAGGSAYLGAFLNAFVHVLMYSYYMVSAAFPNKFNRVKRALTVIQLVQFFIAIVQGCRGMAINCPFPKWMGYTLVAYMSSFVILFSNFWFHAYTKPKRKEENRYDEIKKPTVSVCETEDSNCRSTNGHPQINGHFCVNSAIELVDGKTNKKLKKRQTNLIRTD